MSLSFKILREALYSNLKKEIFLHISIPPFSLPIIFFLTNQQSGSWKKALPTRALIDPNVVKIAPFSPSFLPWPRSKGSAMTISHPFAMLRI